MMPTLPASQSRSPVSRREALRFLGVAGLGAFVGSALARAADASSSGAPSLAGAQPGFYRFKIGSFEALAIQDGGMAMPPPESPFGIGQPREKVAEVLQDALIPSDMVRLPIHVLLVRIGSELVMIDAGCGSVFGPVGGQLTANMAAAGVKPDQVTAIFISHMHGDHFGGLLDAEGKAVFKNAAVFMGRTEHAYWTEKGDESVQKYLNAFKGKWQLVAGGEKLLGGMEVVETFGHTPGHVSLMFSSGTDQLFHVVDVVHNHVISFARPEWQMKFDVQSDVAIATRQRVLDRCAADKARIYGTHLPFPSLGRVRRAGSAFEFVPEPWEFS